MSTLTAPRVPHTAPNAARAYRLSFAGQLKSEWIKLTSLRFTWWIMVVSILVMVGFSALMAWGTSALFDTAADPAASDATPAMPEIGAMVLVSSASFAQLMVAVLGAIFITGEYSSGTIRSTLAASPKRVSMVAAKSLVLSGFVFLAVMIATALSYVVTYPMLNSFNAALDLGEGQSWRVLFGIGLYLMLTSLLALGLGLIARNPAGAISLVLAVILVLPVIVQILQGWFTWAEDLYFYLPASAGERIMIYESSTPAADAEEFLLPESPLTPWQGAGVFAAYVAATLGVGIALLKKRDV